MQGYIHDGPIDCDVDFDPSSLKGKTAIVTGGIDSKPECTASDTDLLGANGIGEAYVRALVTAGYATNIDREHSS